MPQSNKQPTNHTYLLKKFKKHEKELKSHNAIKHLLQTASNTTGAGDEKPRFTVMTGSGGGSPDQCSNFPYTCKQGYILDAETPQDPIASEFYVHFSKTGFTESLYYDNTAYENDWDYMKYCMRPSNLGALLVPFYQNNFSRVGTVTFNTGAAGWHGFSISGAISKAPLDTATMESIKGTMTMTSTNCLSAKGYDNWLWNGRPSSATSRQDTLGFSTLALGATLACWLLKGHSSQTNTDAEVETQNVRRLR